jgi:hypothetical protein
MLYEFDQDAAGPPWVEERHQVATGPRARFPVDELEALGSEAVQLGPDVGRPVGDVMKARALLLQEAGYGGIGGEGFQELQLPHEGDPDPLGREFLNGGAAGSRDAFVQPYGLCEVRNGNCDVIDG